MSVPVDDVRLSDHLVEPVLDGRVVPPPLLRALVRDTVHGDLVALHGIEYYIFRVKKVLNLLQIFLNGFP